MIKNIHFMTKYIWKYKPSMFIFFTFCGIFQAARYLAEIILLGTIINALAKEEALITVLKWIIFYIGTILVSNLFTVFSNYYTTKTFSLLSLQMSKEMMRKSLTLDFACFDDSNFYDQKTRALNQASGAIQRLSGTYISLFSSIVSIISIVSAVQVLTHNPWYLLLSVICVAVSYAVLSINNKLQYNHDMEMTRVRRHTNGYLANLFWGPNTAREMRLFGSGDFFLDKYVAEEKENIQKDVAVQHRMNAGLYIETFVSSLVSMTVMILVSREILNNVVPIGTFLAIVTAVSSLTNQLNTFISNVPSLTQQSRYIDLLKEILFMESNIESMKMDSMILPIKKSYTIEFHNVSFAYPNCEQKVLDNVSFIIHAGEHICIVGENGAGKTTITKLLFRLYDPQEGEILIDGTNIKQYNLDSLRKQLAVVFQDCFVYPDTIKTNLAFGKKYTNEELMKALAAVKLEEKVSESEKGLESQLTRYYDKSGIVLSGGEAQRLFLARTALQTAGIVVLDEPSSSLDPLIEVSLMQDMLQTAREQTVFLVSHRLLFCRHMDKIFVLKEGKIIEEGTHDELISTGGFYKTMYEAQASNYE